jgi:hypothetical protein
MSSSKRPGRLNVRASSPLTSEPMNFVDREGVTPRRTVD